MEDFMLNKEWKEIVLESSLCTGVATFLTLYENVYLSKKKKKKRDYLFSQKLNRLVVNGKSILHGRDVIQKGARWRVGNGKSIPILESPMAAKKSLIYDLFSNCWVHVWCHSWYFDWRWNKKLEQWHARWSLCSKWSRCYQKYPLSPCCIRGCTLLAFNSWWSVHL